MNLSLGFSSCPNDTFIFDALLHHKIDTEGLNFEAHIEDVESLNQKANNNVLNITKLSYHAFAYLTHQYVLLNAGSALGFGVGPLLISKNKDIDVNNANLKVGIPGKLTTANFLLSMAYPHLTNKVVLLFSDIEEALLNNEIDLGLIIHENRFTYAAKGLHKVMDLGDYWEKESHSAIPLGGIVIQRSLPKEVQEKVDRVIRRSIEFAFANPKSSLDFVRMHSQDMTEEVMYQHINLYVNKYSLDLTGLGISAVKNMFDMAVEKGIIKEYAEDFIL